MKNYSKSYISSFILGIENTTFYISKTKIEIEPFFKELCAITTRLNENKGRIFFFGNGASAAFSNHMALDWSKNAGICSFCLSDSALLTALANDYSYEDCFVEFLKINDVNDNDLIVTTSSSGNSQNIVNVLNYCNEKNLKSLAFSGLNSDNNSLNLANYSIYSPYKTYGMVECAHQFFHHLWLDNYMNIYEWNREESQNMNINNFKL